MRRQKKIWLLTLLKNDWSNLNSFLALEARKMARTVWKHCLISCFYCTTSAATQLSAGIRTFLSLLNMVGLHWRFCFVCAIKSVCIRFPAKFKFVLSPFTVKPVATKTKQLRLHREDFEPLSLIGKGAFGEV